MAGIGRYEHTGAAPSTNLTASIGAADLTFSVAAGVGYPTGAIGNFLIAIDPGLPGEEKIVCSARAGTTFTVAPGGRGADNTVASQHVAPTAVVEHVAGGFELDDASRHINPTGGVYSDDHLNYPLLTGARAFTGGVTINTGGLTVSAGGAAITGNETVTGTVTATGTVQGTAHISTLTGTSGRYVGTTNGAPSSGTYLTNDWATDPTSHIVWFCTVGGTPGTWAPSGAGRYTGRVYRSTAWTVNPFNNGTVSCNTVDYDPAGMFSGGVFTAPIAGVWDLSTCVGVITNVAGTAAIFFYNQALSVILSEGPGFYLPANSSPLQAFYTIPLKMAAGDTAVPRFAGSQNATLQGAYDNDGTSSPKPTWFAAEYRGSG